MEPSKLQKMYGREADSDALLNSIRGTKNPLLTLTGLAGVGKTTLIKETFATLNSEGWSCWYIDAETVPNDSVLLDEICQTVKRTETIFEYSIVGLKPILNRERQILFLDGFERIGPFGISMILDILASCPNLKCVVGSRKPLKAPDETLYLLAPLDTPATAITESDGDPTTCSTFVYFTNRCKTLNPNFEIDESLETIIELCNYTEGIPLAIELASGLSTSMSASDMLSILQDNRLEINSRKRGINIDHRNLQSAIESCFNLLTPEAKRLLGALSVFSAPFTVDAAYSICFRYFHQESQVTSADDLLTHFNEIILELTSASLIYEVKAGTSKAGDRFHVLDTIKEFASKTVTKGTIAAINKRHVAYFNTLVENVIVVDPRERSSYSRSLDLCYGDIISAVATASETYALSNLQKLYEGLVYLWNLRGVRNTEAIICKNLYLRTSRENANVSDKIRIIQKCSIVAWHQFKSHEGYELTNEALGLAQAQGNEIETAYTMFHHGNSLLSVRKWDESLALLQETLEILPASLQYLTNTITMSIALGYWGKGDLESAKSKFLEAVKIPYDAQSSERLDPASYSITYAYLGQLYIEQDQLPEALESIEKALKISEEIDNAACKSLALIRLALYQMKTDQLDDAHSNGLEAIRLCLPIGNVTWLNDVVRTFARVVFAQEDYVQAVRILICTAHFSSMEYDSFRARYSAILTTCYERLGQNTFDQLVASVSLMSIAELAGELTET